MDIELRNDRIPRIPFDRQFLDNDENFTTIILNTIVWPNTEPELHVQISSVFEYNNKN